LFGFVAERDIVDVDEDLVAALAVSHLPPGVVGVAPDGSYGGLRPNRPPSSVSGGGVGSEQA
jgi:hypothetical protein